MKPVFYFLYIFLFLSFYYMIFFTCERIKNDTTQSKSVVNKLDTTKSEKRIEKPEINFSLNLKTNNSHCIKDSLIITDKVKLFTKKICYWGDGDSSIYPENQTKLAHKYLTSGIKIIQLVCDTFVPASYRFLVYCDKPDSEDFSIHPYNRPNISHDTLMFNNDLKLIFDAVDESSRWLMKKKIFKPGKAITFNKHETIEITFIPGKTFNDCYCDSTMTLTFVKKRK